MVVLALGILVGACSSSDDKDDAMEGGDGSEAGDGDTADTATGDDATSSSTTTDTGMSGDMVEIPTVECGSTTCMDVGAAFSSFDPSMFMVPGGATTFDAGALGELPTVCCADEEMGICGTSRGGGECMGPPESDERCPMLITGIGVDGSSCCTETGTCGLIDNITGSLDCVPLVEVNELLGMLSSFIDIPAPINCDGSEVELPDAGMGDTMSDDDAGTQ